MLGWECWDGRGVWAYWEGSLGIFSAGRGVWVSLVLGEALGISSAGRGVWAYWEGSLSIFSAGRGVWDSWEGSLGISSAGSGVWMSLVLGGESGLVPLKTFHQEGDAAGQAHCCQWMRVA